MKGAPMGARAMDEIFRGLRPGDRIRFRKRRLRAAPTTTTYGVLGLSKPGDRGPFTVRLDGGEGTHPSAYRIHWTHGDDGPGFYYLQPGTPLATIDRVEKLPREKAPKRGAPRWHWDAKRVDGGNVYQYRQNSRGYVILRSGTGWRLIRETEHRTDVYGEPYWNEEGLGRFKTAQAAKDAAMADEKKRPAKPARPAKAPRPPKPTARVVAFRRARERDIIVVKYKVGVVRDGALTEGQMPESLTLTVTGLFSGGLNAVEHRPAGMTRYQISELPTGRLEISSPMMQPKALTGLAIKKSTKGRTRESTKGRPSGRWTQQGTTTSSGFQWWDLTGADNVRVTGSPATSYPNGSTSPASWTVFVGKDYERPFSSLEEAKKHGEKKATKKKAAKKKATKKKATPLRRGGPLAPALLLGHWFTESQMEALHGEAAARQKTDTPNTTAVMNVARDRGFKPASLAKAQMAFREDLSVLGLPVRSAGSTGNATKKKATKKRATKARRSPPPEFSKAEIVKALREIDTRGYPEDVEVGKHLFESGYVNRDLARDKPWWLLIKGRRTIEGPWYKAQPSDRDTGKKKATKKKATKKKATKARRFLGPILARHRTKANVSRAELAKAMGLTVSTLTQIERGEVRCPPVARLEGAAEVLRVKIGILKRANDCDYDKKKPRARKVSPAAKKESSRLTAALKGI